MLSIGATLLGGSNRVSNLTIACVPCNQAKSNQAIEEVLSHKPDRLATIKRQAKAPLKEAAAVNATRWKLFNALKEMGLPVSSGTGGQTQFNRSQQGIPKANWLDAACVGEIPTLEFYTSEPLLIKATGHGNRQMCGTDKYGLPKQHRSRLQVHQGFKTGDMVQAVVSAGKKIGTYVGRVLCRASGSFDIATQSGRVTGISHKYCQPIYQKDGYTYA